MTVTVERDTYTDPALRRDIAAIRARFGRT
jgi:hypothetical protein